MWKIFEIDDEKLRILEQYCIDRGEFSYTGTGYVDSQTQEILQWFNKFDMMTLVVRAYSKANRDDGNSLKWPKGLLKDPDEQVFLNGEILKSGER